MAETKWNHGCFLVLFLTMISINFHGAISLDPVVDGEYYGILVDAGSSSSKIKLYKWSQPKSISSMPVVKIVNNTKISTPISDFSNNTDGLGPYVDNMLKWASDNIPPAKRSSTPLLILATAGMRFLKSDETYHLLQKVRQILSNSSRNPFAPTLHNDVSVISGEEEGVYAWIAANYLLGFFDSGKPVNQSVGIMEMGGGSTQIAFIPEGPLYDGEFQVRLANRRYSIYVHSFLNFGANGITSEILHQMLSNEPENTTQIQDPCMLQGDQKTVSLDQGKEIEINGSGDAVMCREILDELLKPAQGIECQPKPCAIREVYQPSIGDNGTFYATQAFVYAPNSLQAVRDDGTLDLEQLWDTAHSFCNTTLEEAIKLRPNRGKYLSGDCMQANYIPRLFQNYGFSLDTDRIVLTSKINSQKIDWALGAMLMKLSDRFASTRGSFSIQCPTRASKDNNSAPTTLNNVGILQKAVILSISWLIILIQL